MHNVFKGIVVGCLGYLVWFLSGFVSAFTAGLTGEGSAFQVATVIGFGLMVGGPVVYIIVLPVAGWLRRRR